MQLDALGTLMAFEGGAVALKPRLPDQAAAWPTERPPTHPRLLCAAMVVHQRVVGLLHSTLVPSARYGSGSVASPPLGCACSPVRRTCTFTLWRPSFSRRTKLTRIVTCAELSTAIL